MGQQRKAFRISDLGRHVRDGKNANEAHLMPALVSIPHTFVEDGVDTVGSYAAGTFFRLRFPSLFF